MRYVQTTTATLILVMTEEHKRMLRQHGRITCIDARYKVVQWGLPLFLMVVVDEHGASIPAAYFIVSEESNTAIDEVLGYIKSFVPEWDPQVFNDGQERGRDVGSSHKVH
jgi:hypothetical protein